MSTIKRNPILFGWAVVALLVGLTVLTMPRSQPKPPPDPAYCWIGSDAATEHAELCRLNVDTGYWDT
jgi:hypothetical protein